MLKNVHTLVAEATKHLSTLNYRKSSGDTYLGVWRRFELFCVENGHRYPNRETGDEFLEKTVYSTRVNLSHKKQQKRIIICLFDLAEKGFFPLTIQKVRIPLPECHNAVYSEYSQHLVTAGRLKRQTISGKLSYLKKFLNFLASNNVSDIEKLKAQDVYDYLSSSFCYAAVSSRTANMYFLRNFLSFLVDTHSLDCSLARLFPVILSNKDAVLPSVYDAQELRRVINAQNENTMYVRRNRAIITLAVQLGMRVGDIRSLCIDNIDWQNRRLSYTQQKTTQQVNLPLPEESMFAILDYLKNERPKSDSPYLFIKYRAPHGPFADFNGFHAVIADCFKRANINIKGKHHGFHSIRHSIAVNMLMTDTPYPVVSGILGHTSANTTKTYLKVDTEQLRQLSLEVPDEN